MSKSGRDLASTPRWAAAYDVLRSYRSSWHARYGNPSRSDRISDLVRERVDRMPTRQDVLLWRRGLRSVGQDIAHNPKRFARTVIGAVAVLLLLLVIWLSGSPRSASTQFGSPSEVATASAPSASPAHAAAVSHHVSSWVGVPASERRHSRPAVNSHSSTAPVKGGPGASTRSGGRSVSTAHPDASGTIQTVTRSVPALTTTSGGASANTGAGRGALAAACSQAKVHCVSSFILGTAEQPAAGLTPQESAGLHVQRTTLEEAISAVGQPLQEANLRAAFGPDWRAALGARDGAGTACAYFIDGADPSERMIGLCFANTGILIRKAVIAMTAAPGAALTVAGPDKTSTPGTMASSHYVRLTVQQTTLQQVDSRFGSPSSKAALISEFGQAWVQAVLVGSPSGMSCVFYLAPSPQKEAFRLCFGSTGLLQQKAILGPALDSSG